MSTQLLRMNTTPHLEPSIGPARTDTTSARGNRPRRGAALVEMAIVAPLLFFFFITAFEFCRVSMIRHTVDNAVYESCRRAIIPGASSGAAQDTADGILRTIGLTRTNIRVEPADIGPQTREVTVTIEVPLDNNTFVPPGFTGGKTISRSLTMQREVSGA